MIDYTIADFDRVIYRIHNPERDKSKILVTVQINFFDELKEYDVEGVSWNSFFKNEKYLKSS